MSLANPAGAKAPAETTRQRSVLGILLLFFAGLAILTPLLHEEFVGQRLGVLLILTALIEFLHGFRRATLASQRAAWLSGAITLAMGILLLNAANLAANALVLFYAGWFGLDAVRYFILAWRGRDQRRSRAYCLTAGVANLLVCIALVLFRGALLPWALALATAVHIFGAASHIFLAAVLHWDDVGATVVEDLGLPPNAELEGLVVKLKEQEEARAPIDRGWIIGFILTLFAIHISRMGFDRTYLCVLAPGVAVLGDIGFGLMIALLLVLPVRILSHRLSRGFERRAWSWCLSVESESRGLSRKAVQAFLTRRLRGSIRLRQMRFSMRAALSRSLQTGLPLAAIIAASVPIWGMSWYFNTESWASGVWDSWAAHRTDDWREAMGEAVLKQMPATDPAKTFAVAPPGIAAGGDFAFLVIGDTGEGDASQFSLISSYLDVVRRDEVKFVVFSSDVIYPSGEMRDYEAKFWLPYMGTSKPVYAIPGNHDWYDALEGFVATFFEPNAARIAMRARVEVDKHFTSTTDRRIEELIAEATRLRKEYRVPTQFQQAPYFQFQTDTFALFAIDTGVVKRIDPVQLNWLKLALESAKGKTKMAIIGHPFYAGGRDETEGNEDFAALHELLRQHDVAICMAGDTHDLEYYIEKPAGTAKRIDHFVNGGGGAYLSYGTSLDWPEKPVTDEWAYYPAKAQVTTKIEATTPIWKWPAWWWTKNMGGWPFSAEFLSAAFDANVAPFYQSFMVVHVEPSKNRIRLVPYGIHGQLRWSDLERSTGLLPAGTKPDGLAAWIVEMRKN